LSRENSFLTMVREVCSLGRSRLDRPHTKTGDVDAALQLVEGLQAIDPDGQPCDISLSLDLLAPRAPYFDQLVLDAIAAGVSQIVNLGAGYDDRALRFSATGVRFFDLDLPHVIADKTCRIEAMDFDASQMTLIPVDFGADDVARVLARAGHTTDQPTLFIAEHLLLFLAPKDVDRLFTTISSRAAAGSTLAITAEVHPAGLNSELVVATVDEEMFGGAGPLHTISTREAWLTRFAKAGWTVKDVVSVSSVDHFELSMSGQTVLIQTQFLTATR
jgi:methyltransferase (TIGR00027 family)